MNRSRRRRLALRVLAVMIGMGALGFGGIALADSGPSTPPGSTIIDPPTSGTTGGMQPLDLVWL